MYVCVVTPIALLFQISFQHWNSIFQFSSLLMKLWVFFTQCFQDVVFKPFVPNALFLYSLKTSENITIFWCFQMVEKGCIVNKWVNLREPNGHIFIDLPSILLRDSTSTVCRYFIDYERQIHFERMTLIQRR